MKSITLTAMVITYSIGIMTIFVAGDEGVAILGYFIVHAGAAINLVALIIIFSGCGKKLKKSEWLELSLTSLPLIGLLVFRTIVVKS